MRCYIFTVNLRFNTHIGSDYTIMFLMNTVTLVFVSIEKVQHLHEAVFRHFISGN